MFMYAVKKPTAAAAAALGEDGTAVFCEGPGLLFASARGETPDAGIGLPPPPQLGETVRFDKAVPLDVARYRGLGRIERRGAARRRHPLKAQLKEKRLLVTTLEAVLPVNGLLHDPDGLGDGKPSILLPIDTAVDKRARFRYGLDELAERAPAKQALGQLGAHRRRGGHRIAGSDHLDQRMESCAPVPCDEHAPAHLPINPDQDTSCRYSQSTHGIQLISGPWLILSNANRQYPDAQDDI